MMVRGCNGLPAAGACDCVTAPVNRSVATLGRQCNPYKRAQVQFHKRLKVTMALLMFLLVLNIGIANAMDGTRTEDILVSNAHPLTGDSGKKHVLTPGSSSLEIKISSSGRLVRRLIGSSAPDCAHTCGACSPCKIQIVNYECSNDLGSHAEACPLGYLCICNGKAFPIP